MAGSSSQELSPPDYSCWLNGSPSDANKIELVIFRVGESSHGARPRAFHGPLEHMEHR